MGLLQFSNSTTKAGIVEQIAKRTSTQNASSNAYSLAEKTVDVNFALANFLILANQGAGHFKPVDDTNQTDYPIIYAAIQNGVQDITLTTDANGNQILDIYKIRVQDASGNWHTLERVDINDTDDTFINDTTTGIPTTFNVTANGIFFNVIPNFSGTAELYISRGGSYFVSTDTTKTAGIPEIFQEYLVMRPSYLYCANRGMAVAKVYYNILYGADGKGGMEKAIMSYYSNRDRTTKRQMVANGSRISGNASNSNR